VLLCNLVEIAIRVGAPRIVRTRGIPYPAGDPALDAPRERSWRLALLGEALRALASEVTRPTVFEASSTPAEAVAR
jgi:betaine reductase